MTVADPVALVAGVVAGGLALLGGYLVGSIPIAERLGRVAGMDPAPVGEGRWGRGATPGRHSPGVQEIWRVAGPGWGLLALAASLAKGLLPVAIAVVTWSWWAGWAAALAVVVGSRLPLLGRLSGARDLVVLAGACIGLSPLAGITAAILALVAGGATRTLGGKVGFAAAVTGGATFATLAVVELGEPARAVAVSVIVAAAAVPCPVSRR